MSETIELEITGMTCEHCVRAVTSALEDVEGVTKADVSLEECAARIEGEQVDVRALVEAVNEEGYEAAAR